MPANNIKVLSPLEAKFCRTRFSFELKDDCTLVRTNGYNRTTAHKLTGFSQTFIYDGKKRKISITQTAIKYWIDNFRVYSLIDVQNAINMLLMTYQVVDVASIRSILADPNCIQIRKV